MHDLDRLIAATAADNVTIIGRWIVLLLAIIAVCVAIIAYKI